MKPSMKSLLGLLAVCALLLVGCDEGTISSVTPETSDKPVPEGTFDQVPDESAGKVDGTLGEFIPGQYIVVFRGDVRNPQALAQQMTAAHGGALTHRYGSALKGFAAALSEQAVEALKKNPNVAFVEQDRRVSLDGTQTGATWGLDRIDQRDLPLNNTYTYTPTGAGVKAYILDTGIRTSHNDFGGRASVGYDAIGDGQNGQDCHGHGTHVAGTVGGTTYGVAKGVSLVAVRVLNCSGSGSNSQVIAGIDYVTQQKQNNPATPMVANMSLGGGVSTALDNAVNNSIAAGVTYAVAAGNSNANACNGSPARVAAALTVGSTTSTDARSSFSNYGTCLDLFAPGSSITSAWHTSNTATNTISGTSMATPHVAGVAALYLEDNPSAAPATVTNAILSSASSGRVSNPGSGSPNLLLYSPLTEEEPGGGGAPCTNCEHYAGSLSGTGDYDYHPNGTYYYSGSGTHRGYLRGPSSGADFDLYLQKWNGWYWVNVASGISSTSNEDVVYTGSSGYYVWRIYAYSGSGAYDFWMERP